MKAYAAQMHLHGSMSEGPASCLAHDYQAVTTGYADLLWWTDHDFRVANFAKLQRFGFSALSEELDHINRDPAATERGAKATATWRPVGPDGRPLVEAGATPEFGRVEVDPAGFDSGSTTSLRFVLPPLVEELDSAAGGGPMTAATSSVERRCLYELQFGAHYETFPLLTRPVLRLAVFPEEGVGETGRLLIRLTLSEQPPDLTNTRLTYVLGGAAAEAEGVSIEQTAHGPGAAVIHLPYVLGEWNEVTLDPAADVERLGLRGGLDNSLHRLQIGIASDGPAVAARVGRLEVQVAHRGPGVLTLHRQMLQRLPTRVRHLVGLEVSYYGQHVTGFGSAVPIPDYEGLLPRGLTSEDVVAHIHRYGGLACLAHPPRADLEATVNTLAAARVFGADLMEVAHGAAGLTERLWLWDRLARRGVIVTGIGVSDAHTAKQGWAATPSRPVAWVTRIWADSDDEDQLLASLGRGHVFFADPSAFRGDLELSGPNGSQMGDVLLVPESTNAAPTLAASLASITPGDLLTWWANGALVGATTANQTTLHDEWRANLSLPLQTLVAVRVQLHRPSLASTPFGGLIASSNPIYLSRNAPETGHRVVVAHA